MNLARLYYQIHNNYPTGTKVIIYNSVTASTNVDNCLEVDDIIYN